MELSINGNDQGDLSWPRLAGQVGG